MKGLRTKENTRDNRKLFVSFENIAKSKTKFFDIKLKNFSLKFFLFALALFALLPEIIWAASVTLTWNRNTEPDVVGYVVYWGTKPRSEEDYPNSAKINDNKNDGTPISYTVEGLEEGKTYYFAVKAFDAEGLYSDYSEEVSATIPASDSGSGEDNQSGNNSEEGSQSGGNSGSSENQDSGNEGGNGGGETIPQFIKRINFQSYRSWEIPEGYEKDTGEVYSEQRGYGWNLRLRSIMDYGMVGDKRQDTVAWVYRGYKWELSLPNGEYEVTLGVGDPRFSISGQSVNVEGNVLTFNTMRGQFKEEKIRVTVNDGRLTLSFNPANMVFLDYVIVEGI